MPRKVILGLGISIDGHIARRNGAIDYLVIDKEGETVMAEFFAKIDTTIMGRKTAAATAEMRKSGEIPDMPGISNYVFSRRWKPGKRDGFEMVIGSLTAFVRKLKRRKGKDIYLGGGGQLCRSFLQEDLVDELFLGLAPVLLGDGIPGFPGKLPQRDFKLTECKSYRMDRSGYATSGCGRRLADNPRGREIVVENSDHTNIPPDVVVNAVRDIVAAARAEVPPPVKYQLWATRTCLHLTF